MRFEPRIKGDINDNSLGKLLVKIKPRFDQEIKNQNLANLLVRIWLKWIDILILPDFIHKAIHNVTKPLVLRHHSQKNKPSKTKILQFLVISTEL